jgi:hypothetical protein
MGASKASLEVAYTFFLRRSAPSDHPPQVILNNDNDDASGTTKFRSTHSMARSWASSLSALL